MGRWDLVRREHVLAAVQEYEELGQTRFLDKYRFGRARSYQLIVDGRSYDSKAILGAD
jgi:putative restriction endonuclease